MILLIIHIYDETGVLQYVNIFVYFYQEMYSLYSYLFSFCINLIWIKIQVCNLFAMYNNAEKYCVIPMKCGYSQICEFCKCLMTATLGP